jgi:double-stranded uracil-DNA glycosylase
VSPPGRDELVAATERSVADLVADDLAILFCGINPGRYSGASGHHFAGPGNRFWRALAGAGLTARELRPDEGHLLLESGIGITNLVARTTATAAELGRTEFVEGGARLRTVVAARHPSVVAVLGVGAYRHAFDRRAVLGRQAEETTGAVTFVLPNPSGLQARYGLEELVTMFGEVRDAVPAGRRRRSADPQPGSARSA